LKWNEGNNGTKETGFLLCARDEVERWELEDYGKRGKWL